MFWRSPVDQPTWARPGLLAVGALAALSYTWRRRGDPARLRPPASGSSALVFAAVSLLLVPAITTGTVVAEGLGSFSTPFQSASATQETTTGPKRFQATAARYAAYVRRSFAPSAIVEADDSAALAAPYIMVTGREFLPIGGY